MLVADEVNVFVAGGGPAGITAATAAACIGARTMGEMLDLTIQAE